MQTVRKLTPGGERLSRAQQVAAQIEDEILAARLPTGAHLGRRVEFMDRFAISPTIMNETMRILRTRGLVGVRRGTGGGLFVASQPPQIRLGAMDLWFHESSTHPLELFEARVHLESVLTSAAFARAGEQDLAAMEAALVLLEDADDAREYLNAVMALHRAVAAASRIAVLDGIHQTLVTTISATLSRAEFIDGYEEMLHHSIEVHRGIVTAIADQNAAAFAKVMRLHDDDLIRADDPRRSPHPHGTR